MSRFYILHLLVFSFSVVRGFNYSPDWPSLDSRPLPTWYDEAKIGIFMHFGPYSVPGFRSEWFWWNWISNASDVSDFMQDNYPPKFTYQDFGSMLTMEFFNASEFADLVLESGAKYLVFTSKHHDGFANFDSKYTFGWNSVSVGSGKNVLRLLKDAFMQRDPQFHFGIYYSLFEWVNPLYLSDKSNKFQTKEYVLNKMLPEMKQLAEEFEPHVWWSDGDWETVPEYFSSQEFLAWLFNESPSRDVVVTNDRWGQGTGQKHGSFYSGPDRWQPGYLIDHKWENAMTVNKRSWGIRRNMNIEEIMTPEELISQVAITVSCGGNILINVGPTKEGTIVPIFQERLKQLGSWLHVNGEAIYQTKPWTHQNDSLARNPDVWYTSKGADVYAIVLGWPLQEDTLELGSVKADNSMSSIHILGLNQALNFEQGSDRLKIQLPSFFKLFHACKACQWAFVLKMSHVAPTHQENVPKVQVL